MHKYCIMRRAICANLFGYFYAQLVSELGAEKHETIIVVVEVNAIVWMRNRDRQAHNFDYNISG